MHVIFFGFLLAALNCIVGWKLYDLSLLPRLLALLVFLGLIIPCMAMRRRLASLDFNVLRDPIVVCYGVYLLATVASLGFALNPTAGFTDVFKTFGAFLVLCLSCLLLRTRAGWPGLLAKTVIIAAFLAVAGGFFQIISMCGLRIPTRAEAEMVNGWMGNVNLFAGFLNLLLPLSLCGVRILKGCWRAGSGFAAVALVCLIVLLQSRGAYIGMVLSGMLLLCMLWVYRKEFGIRVFQRLSVAKVSAIVLLGLCILALALGSNNAASQRARSLFRRDLSSIDGGRLMVWGITLKMISSHPVAGVGAGNFILNFDEHLSDPGLDPAKLQIQWAQPHNDFLQVYAEKGLIGFLAFAGLFVFAFRNGTKVFRLASREDELWISLFALMGLTAYGVASCVDFPVERIPQQIYLAVYLAILVVARHSSRESALKSIPGNPMAVRFGVSVALAGVALGITYSIHALWQETYVCQARRATTKNDYVSGLEAANRAATPWKTLDPVATPVAFLQGDCLWQIGNRLSAIERYEEARRQHPNGVYILQQLGMAYSETGAYPKALECLARAAHLHPYDPEILEQFSRAKQQIER